MPHVLRSLTVVGLTGLIFVTIGLPQRVAAAQSGASAGNTKQAGGSGSATRQAEAAAGELNATAVRALSSRQYAQAIELLNRARRLLPSRPWHCVQPGPGVRPGRPVRRGDRATAARGRRSTKADPHKKQTVHFLLGTAYFETGQFGPAAEQLEAVRSDPEFAENALYLLEESYRKSGQAARAEQAFLDLTKVKPDSALVHKLLGTAYDTQGRFPEALAEFEKAAQSDPSLPEVGFDAGLLCLKLHDEVAARKWLEAELKLNPCYAAAHYYLGDIERKASRWAPAAESYRKAIGCAPAYADAHLALGMVLQAQGLNSEALPVLRRAVELAPSKSEAHFQLAKSLAKAGRTAESRAEWKKAQALASSPEVK